MKQKSMMGKVRKLDKLQKDIKSTCFGDWVYKIIPILEAIELYAQYREGLAIAVVEGAGVPFVRTFEEWLDDEPLEE